MRIRAGFVSNSSSTSFLIIARGELTWERFAGLMGVGPSSPLGVVFRQLYDDMTRNAEAELDLARVEGVANWDVLLRARKGRLSARMIEKLESSRTPGSHAYFGTLQSDETPIESFFCTDSFEAEDDAVYVNALECAW